MSDVRRLAALSMVTPLAEEVASQIDSSIADKAEIAALTTVTTADATDLDTAEALANALKTKVNAIIAALKA